MKGQIKMALKTLLDDAVETGFSGLDKMKVGSEEYNATAKQLVEMSDRIIKIEELEANVENQKLVREIDEKLRLKQIKQEQIDRYVKHGLTAISVVGGLALTVWGALASWKYEETGTVTSLAGRKFVNNLLPNFKR